MATAPEDLEPQNVHDYRETLAARERTVADPQKIAFLKQKLADLDRRPSAPVLTKEEFLALVIDD